MVYSEYTVVVFHKYCIISIFTYSELKDLSGPYSTLSEYFIILFLVLGFRSVEFV